MADEIIKIKNGGWRTFGIIAGIITGVYVLISLITGKWNPLRWFSSKPDEIEKSDFEKCEESNKAKADGEPCGNCVPAGSGQPNFNGVIKDGKCVVRQQTAPNFIVKRYMVSNSNGALIYVLQGNNFISPRMGSRVPYKTEIKILGISPKRDYVNTSFGWLSVNDIGEIQ